MSTLAQVIASLKARDAAMITMFGTAPSRLVYWDKDEKPVLPNEPAPWVFFYLETGRPGQPAGYGGGRGQNLYRTDGDLTGLIFLPKGYGLEEHAAYGEHVAAAFRSHRDSYVSCFGVEPQPAVDGSSLKPPGLDSEVVNYDCIVVQVPFHYDHVG